MLLMIFLSVIPPLPGKDVPTARLAMKQLLESQAVSSLADDSTVLKKVLSDYSQSASIAIVCVEWDQEGARYQVPPSSKTLGLGEMTSEDGDYIQIHTSGTGRIPARRSGRSRTVEAFHFVMSFNRFGTQGILVLPFWVDLNRRDPESPKIVSWGIIEERVAYVEKSEGSGGSG